MHFEHKVQYIKSVLYKVVILSCKLRHNYKLQSLTLQKQSMCKSLISYIHTTAPAWDFLEKYNFKYLMLARILESENQKEKFLYKIVKPERHNFTLHCVNDLNACKGFASLAAMYPLRHFF